MGYYYNPPTQLPSVGRLLESKSTYREMVNQLQPGEHLYGLYDRGPFFNAPHLCTSYEFNAFEEMVDGIEMVRYGFYAVPHAISGSHYPVET